MFAHCKWIRDPANPVLPPDPDRAYESVRCMNPFVVRIGDEYRLYHAGGHPEGHHRIALSPRRDVPKEDIAVAVPMDWADGDLYRLLYSSIGTRFGCYSISEAFSTDGYAWRRGQGEENLSLAPDPNSEWESKMVQYPHAIEEAGRMRLFYCGNKYGATGIGTAVG